MDNAVAGDDIDYLIVVEVGRLWLARAVVIQVVVKPAARQQIEVCPNYILTERAFTQFSRNLFTAHELTQMVVIAGVETYERVRRLNPWVTGFLPNANDEPRLIGGEGLAWDEGATASRWMEAALRSPMGGWLERREMKRKIARFQRHNGGDGEASFSPDWCKGHFGGHAERVREALQRRLASMTVGVEV